MAIATPKKSSKILRSAAALCAFSLSFALLVWGLPQAKLRPGTYPTKFTYSDVRDTSADTFFASRGFHELSHLALYHGIGASIEHARQADIIIIGNSRGQLGYSESVMVGEARKLGLRVFNLAVGHADNVTFALDVIEKYDLRPRVLIANGGWFFYKNNYSSWASEVVGMTPWQARKTFYEYTLGWELESRLHQHLPYLDYFAKYRYPWIHYRSEVTGWWRNTRVPQRRYPIDIGEDKKSYARQLPRVQELKQELDRRGTQLVLTVLPFRKVQTGHLPYFSEQLGVPYILPPFEELATADSSHLTPDSAELASRYIWEKLLQLPQVRTRLDLDGEDPS